MANQLALVASSAQEAPLDPEIEIDLEDHLITLVRYFQESEDQCRASRERSERCRDYRNNVQYTAEELAALKKRGQAPTYVNYIARKVDTVCGLERRSRSAPKAWPRNPQDDQESEAATDALVFIADQNRFDMTRSEVYEDILVEGTGGAEVTVEQRPDGTTDICIKRVPWDRLWWDPHSRALDFEDALYKGIAIWMEKAEALRRWPDAGYAIEQTLGPNSFSQTFDDRPHYTWFDSKRNRIRVLQCHYQRDGEWWVATFTKGGFFEEPAISPYKDEYGQSTSNLIMRSGYVNRENERYGHAEGLIPLQDEINKRRSKALHLLSSRQTYGNQQGITDVNAAKQQLARPDGHVEINGGAQFGKDFGILPTGDMASGQFELLQQALGEMNATGANAALQGKDNAAPSGIALQTKIQAGATELEPQADGLREWSRAIYRAAWMCVRQFWTDEKWIRVTDDEKNLKFVGLNRKITVADKLAQMPDEQRSMTMQQMGLQPGDPRLQQVLEVEHDVAGLAVDIEIEEGPDLAAMRSENFQILTQLAGAPGYAGQIPFEALVRASGLPPSEKDKLIEAIEKNKEGAGQAQQQAAQQAQQLNAAKVQADIHNKDADTLKKQAEAEATLQQLGFNSATQLQGALAGQLQFGPAPLQ